MSMEVTSLNSNAGSESYFKPIREGLGSAFIGAGNLFSAIGEGMDNLKNSLPSTTNSYYGYPIFGGFPYGGYHHCHGGFFPGSIHGCMHGFWGIPTGPCHYTPIFADPMPTFNFRNINVDIPSPIHAEDGQQFAPANLKLPDVSVTSNPWATPIFGASPDFYLSLGLNPYNHTVVERGYYPTPYPSTYQQPGFNGGLPGMASPQCPQEVIREIQNMTPDMYLHPEKYQPKAQSPESTTTQQPDKTGEASANNCSSVGIDTPSYVSEIRNKKQNGTTLTPQEAEIKKNFELLTTKYSPFEADNDGNWKTDANNNKITSKIHRKIVELSDMIDAGDEESILAFIKKTSPMELAAIEYYWNDIQKKDENGADVQLNPKPLREMIKDACNNDWLDWTNKNTDEANEIFEELDKKTVMISPRSMAQSLRQALENHKMFGVGLNEPKVVELLTKMKDNKAYAKAVLEEYRGKFGDNPRSIIRNGKWFASRATKELAREVFSMTEN